ncbi:GNAT family N-acetyltransferase [Pseudomonas capeferrum]|uniref:GNAT family N-acetyltransferase n=1 Tax=Pseudomonas capeferrum TaxID=1495066 RepID=UPI0015E2FF10|nr:GNAT family N-acetyltransferase [Pseudomonas capeferrum]MBA1204653.1 GNAT family N-acetyltransferase [Pseudomonas capeferrum]
MQLIDYRHLTPFQRSQLIDIEVHLDQIRFSGDIANALYILISTKGDDRRGIALVHQGVPRGFMLLERGPFLPFWAQADAAALCALQIDRNMQGQGLGRFCMTALPDLVRTLWPEVRLLQLSVDPENQAALALYHATGWRESGTGCRARQGYELQLSLML